MAESKLQEPILETHKKERKELQAKIQDLKHCVAKGDKKKKKEILTKVAMLESELSAKHDKELREYLNSTVQENGQKNGGCGEMKDLVVQCDDSEPQLETSCKKISKAQKRRNKVALKAKMREETILQQEINNLSGVRHIESEKLNEILSSRGLSIYEILSDGDCLYKAVEHQLSNLNLQNTSVKELRQKTSDYMLKHREDFIPFLSSESGDLMSDEQYENYCCEIATKPTWGGQVEIQALSHVCSTAIEVIQANGPSILAGEDYPTTRLTLSYHRHMYGLGEHYNSVIEKVDVDEDI